MPAIGKPFVTMATLTVNSSRPARNSLVPSSGSTITKLGSRFAAAARPTLSSAITVMPGSRRETPSTMTASDATSAAVTGERSFLMCRSTDENGVASVAAAARETISVSASKYCSACRGVIAAVTTCRSP